MVKVVLDMDPGVDDALALMMAMNSPELEVVGITTVSGNVHVEKTSVNVLKILEALGFEHVPVYRGAANPLVRNLETAEWVHGVDGLGDSGLPQPKRKPLPGAVNYLVETLMNEPGLTLVATGPLTNIALAFMIEPELPRRIGKMVVMGGAFNLTPHSYGNATPVSEFNIYVDPEAADVVVRSGVKPLFVGLDVTADPATALKREDLQRFADSSSKTASIVGRILRNPLERFGYLNLHDPMAVATVIKPSLFRTFDAEVYVVLCDGLTRGMTVVERRPWVEKRPNAEVCGGVDGKEFLRLFFERLGL